MAEPLGGFLRYQADRSAAGVSMGEARVGLITGASSGIGRATAARLSGAGHIVYGTSRNPDQTSYPWRMLALDVCDDASLAAAVDGVLAEQGRIDAVVNNAGLVLSGTIEDTSLDEIGTRDLPKPVLAGSLLASVRTTIASLQ
jgi:NADP-dependent 3-hydroxy acid dehydrogenase YdfG